MKDITLYGHPDSGHAYKVAFALALADLPHERRYIDIWADPATRPADFLARSAFAEVPMLTIGHEAFVQSANILHIIAERTGKWGGESPARLAAVREILFWEANRIGMCLPQLIENRRVQGEGFPPGAIEWLQMRHRTDVARFDRLLGDKPFLLGDTPTVADCAVLGYCQWHDKAGVTPSAALSRWLDRMRALPAYRPAADFFPKP